ncbi:hypothetical protein [Paenibacillus harenae]|uniref:hypothetical protein n=1 Tax=Paenibacillus harenae TaxID=306543 RepID=UPI0027916AE5|nr:hypothetical protein [Paenibacillus harenae]MDQ0062344.1 hypothetical protein [Paenibacillus harenae]
MNNKIAEIKEALSKATQGKWDGDGGVLIESYNAEGKFIKNIAATFGSYNLNNFNHEADAHLIGNAPTYISYLLDELEKAKKSNNNMWECPDCGFAYDACHVDVDANGLETGENTCPLCAEEALTKENERLLSEHTAMKEALEEIAYDGRSNLTLLGGVIHARKVLSSLQCPTEKEDNANG